MNSNQRLEMKKTRIVTEANWLMWVLVLFMLGFASSAFSETTGGMLIMAPLNPEFVQRQQLLHPQTTTIPGNAPLNPDFVQQLYPDTLSTTPGRGKGHLPSPIDRSHMRGLTPKMDTMTGFISGVYPPSFDLRTSGDVTSVKSQGQCGACWTFGANASLESTTLMGGGSAYDYSENHMNVRHGFDNLPCKGGNGDMAGAYMSRWGSTLAAGPVYEVDDPYDDTFPYTSVAGLLPRAHLQEFLVLPDRGNGTNNDIYKNALMNYGAVSVGIWSEGLGTSSNPNWDSATNAYYYNGSAYPDHEVTLVGWDDNYAATNFSTIPPGNGAFIVKNSWGTGFGSSGYFYLSYYDTKLSDAHVFIKPESLNNYTRSYMYDPFGQSDSLGYISNPNSAWGANVFTAVASEPLQAVAFNTMTLNSSYEVYIYTGVTSTPDTGVLEGGVVNTTGSFPYAGYHTLTLSRPVSLMAGQKFAVVVKFTTPGYNYPLPMEEPIQGYDSAASASAGQSYISLNGTSWTDITSLYANTNVNIRAFTVPGVSYLLTVAKTGSGSGTVTSNPTGISCGTDCSESYASGTSVSLTATPSAGNTFVGWSGACTGSSTCVVSMTAAKNVTATFNAVVPIPLGVALDNTDQVWSTTGDASWFGQTAVSFTGGSAAQSGLITANQASHLDTTVTGPGTLTFYWKVSSESCCDFLRFSMDGAALPSLPPISGVVDWQQKTVSIPSGQHTLRWSYTKDGSVNLGADAGWVDAVIYTLPSYGLTVTTSGLGTVTSNPAGINCSTGGSDCSESYASGTPVTLTATPSTGYTFSGWSGVCTGSSTCALQMTTAKSVTATFSVIQNNNPGGATTGIAVTKAVCSNGMTGQVNSIHVNNNSWDCTSKLTIRPGDSITMTITGTAN